MNYDIDNYVHESEFGQQVLLMLALGFMIGTNFFIALVVQAILLRQV